MARRYYIIERRLPSLDGDGWEDWRPTSAAYGEPVHERRKNAVSHVRTLREEAFSTNVQYRIVPADVREPAGRRRR